jgi:hypothetical protein
MPETSSTTRWCRLLLLLGILYPLLSDSMLHALTMNELVNDRKMSPKRFANYFENFRFEDRFVFDVQSPPAVSFEALRRLYRLCGAG